MKKIVFGITSLGIGGAERVLVDIANKLKDEYEITIFTLYRGGAFEKELDSKIKHISLYDVPYESMSSIKRKIIPIYVLTCGKRIYNKYIKGKFDTEIAFLEGPITRIFKYKGNSKKIVWVHNDIRKVFGYSLKSKLKGKIDKTIYDKYDNIIFVSKDNKEAFNDMYLNSKNPYIEAKEKVIYNYIDKDRIIKKAQSSDFNTYNHKEEREEINSEDTKKNEEEIDKTRPSIVTVARLVEQKAIDRLAKVHKRLIDDGYIHNIYVIGDGPEKKNLEDLIKDLKIEKTFKLLGKKENPYPYVKEADYFALLTYFEGYPMAVEEAKILDKKIIITDTAAKEVVKDYDKKMILENNEQSIYEGLCKILEKGMPEKEKNKEYDNSYLLDEIRQLI